MLVQVNTDHTIAGNAAQNTAIETTVRRTLAHLSEHLTRIEVHLGDVNGDKSGRNDKRCMMEARLADHQPIAVTEHADTITLAVDQAAAKLKRLVTSTIEKLASRP